MEIAPAGGGAYQQPEEGKNEEELQLTFRNSLKQMMTTGPLNLLLPCTIIALISYYAGWPEGVTFVFSLLALAPLAERLGFVTEQLAIHTNETIGGLLNASFGNATELIVAISALSRGLFRLVQLSLLGSILSNMLLVLGMAFWFGGIKFKVQTYGKISSQINMTLLMLSTMGILLPTVLRASNYDSDESDMGFSRAVSLVLFSLYFIFLYFQLVTHKYLYEGEETEPLVADSPGGSVKVKPSPRAHRAPLSSTDTDLENGSPVERQPGHHTIEKSVRTLSEVPLLDAPIDSSNRDQKEGEGGGMGTVALPPAPLKLEETEAEGGEGEEDDDEEEDVLGYRNALIWLGIITVLIALLSDAISASIEAAASSAGISAIFISAIVLPIVGNAAEHAGAVMFAMKGKLDLSLGVAIGSSTQIALLVMPLLVLLGWMMNKDMNLDFGGYESACLFLSVVSVTFAIKDGNSNWLVGVTMVAMYIVIACGFWAHKDDSLKSVGHPGSG